MGAGVLAEASFRPEFGVGSDAIRSTCRSTVSRSRRSCARGRLLNGSRWTRGWDSRCEVDSSRLSESSVSLDPRKALVMDFSGTRKPDRVGFPFGVAAVVAGTLGFGFCGGLAWLDEFPKSLSKTPACGFAVDSSIESSCPKQGRGIRRVVINTHAQATSFLIMVVRSIRKTPANNEARLKSLPRSSGVRLGRIEQIGGF